MTVVFVEGFDLYNGIQANIGAQSRWSYVAGAAGGASSIIAGRFGGQAARFTPNTLYQGARAFLPAAYSSVTVGAAIRASSLATSGSFCLHLMGGLATQICLLFYITGSVGVYRGATAAQNGSTLLADSVGGILFPNTWHYVELSAVIHASAGSIKVAVDGVEVINISGINTKPSANVDQIQIVATASGTSTVGPTMDFDDIYVLDSATRLGERRVETLRPNADTATLDWTPDTGATNYTQVDDTTADGASTYVQSSIVGDHDLYELTDLSTNPLVIDAVQPVQFMAKTDSATRTAYITVQSAGTDDDGTAFALSADYNPFRRLLLVDPHDSAAWTKAKVDALKMGPKVAS